MPAHSQTSTAAVVAAGRRLLEERGKDALTMRDVADAVGVRPPSLYKRVRGRSDLVRLILEDVANELTAALDAAASSGDPAADVRAMAAAYRAFAHANPVAYALMYAPQAVPGATARSVPGAPTRAVRSSSRFLGVVTELAGPGRAPGRPHDRGLGERVHRDGASGSVHARRRRPAGLGLRPGPGRRRRPLHEHCRRGRRTRPGSAWCSA